VGLERGPLSLVMIIEKLFQGNSGSGLENRNNDCGRIVALSTQHPLSAKVGTMYVCVRGGPNQPLHRDPQWSIESWY
jgi:hypothetical protein